MKKTKDDVTTDVNDSVELEDVKATEQSIVPPHMLDAIKAGKNKTAAEKASEQKELDEKVRTERDESAKKPGFTKVTSVTSTATPTAKKEAKTEEVSKKKSPIWDSLKDRQISVFSLPATSVSYHLAFISETPTSLIGGFQIPALISSLESNFGKEFEFTVFDKKKVEIKKK